jgi:hypothetical protein
MTCKEIEILLPALFEGVLSTDEAKRVRDHLTGCPSCSKALEDLKASGEMVRNLEEVEPPPWLKTRVMARVREEAGPKESIFRKLFYPLHIKIPIQALATALIAVVAWNVYKTGEPEFRQIAPPPAAVQEAPQTRAPSAPVKAPETAPMPPFMKKEAGEPAGLREKKAPAPSDSNVEDRAMRHQPNVREEAKTDAVKLAEPAKAARPATSSLKDEDVLKGAGAMGQAEMDRAMQAPAGDQKQKAMKAPVGSVAKEAGKREASPGASPMLSATPPAQPVLNMILRASDPGAASAEATDILKRLGGQVVRRQTVEGRETLSATIPSEKLEAFREKLRGLGKIQEKQTASSLPTGELSIRIEILPE